MHKKTTIVKIILNDCLLDNPTFSRKSRQKAFQLVPYTAVVFTSPCRRHTLPLFPRPRNVRDKAGKKLFNGYHTLLRSSRAPAGGTLCRSFPGPGTSEKKQAKSVSTGTIHCCSLYEPLPAAHFAGLSRAPGQVSRCRGRGFQPAGWEALCRSIYYDAVILC